MSLPLLSASPPWIHFFGDCVLDTRRFELRRAGVPVAVQAKVLDLLIYLVENRDRLLSKEEIQQAIWPGVSVGETSLNQAIMQARRAVGDPRLIVTVRGRGYRLI